MSIATIVGRGYGTSSYADAHKVPTFGYASGVPAALISDAVIRVQDHRYIFRAGERQTVLTVKERNRTIIATHHH